MPKKCNCKRQKESFTTVNQVKSLTKNQDKRPITLSEVVIVDNELNIEAG